MEIKLDTIVERDIDLLIMEEFITSKEFAQIFLDAVNIHDSYAVVQAIHSKRDPNLGESDIVFILNICGVYHALHIENKINARFMPSQLKRYSLRAEQDIFNRKYDEYSVIIAAPTKYLAKSKEAKKFKYQVKYEQLRDYFAAKDDLRSKYKLTLIERAIGERKIIASSMQNFRKDGTLESSAIFDRHGNVAYTTYYDEKGRPLAGVCGDFMTWEMLDSHTIKISGDGEMDDFSSSTPPPWRMHEITSVIIEEGVQSIGTHAFSGNQTNMCVETVVLPKSMIHIPNNAFSGSPFSQQKIP